MLMSDVSTAIGGHASVRDIALRLAERLMDDTDLLRAELYGHGPLTRKRFCELLGIGESTLTGWLQTERIPQSSAVAYALFLLSTELLKRLDEDRDQTRIVALTDGYAVVKFMAGEDGQPVGKIVASGIEDLATARQLAFAQSPAFAGLVARHTALLEDQIETTVEAGNDTPYRMAQLNGELEVLKSLAKLTAGRETATKKPEKARGKAAASAERGAS